MTTRFTNRTEAGRQLAGALERFREDDRVVILALPRGGVPVGYEIARQLGAPLDVCLVRKLGVPGQEELAAGAVAEGGYSVVNEQITRHVSLPGQAIAEMTVQEEKEIQWRAERYRGDRNPVPVDGKTVILVDDGLATGATMRVAVQAVHHRGAGRIVVAAPVAPSETCTTLEQEADEVVVLSTPEGFGSIGAWYEDFAQVSDEEVQRLLDKAQAFAPRE